MNATIGMRRSNLKKIIIIIKKKNLHGTQVHGARVPFKTPLYDSLNAAIGMNSSSTNFFFFKFHLA